MDKTTDHVVIFISKGDLRFDDDDLLPVRVFWFVCRKMLYPGFNNAYVTIGLF